MDLSLTKTADVLSDFRHYAMRDHHVDVAAAELVAVQALTNVVGPNARAWLTHEEVSKGRRLLPTIVARVLDATRIAEALDREFPSRPAPVAKASPTTKQIQLLKSGEEKIVYGVVLEPTKELNKPDSQGDIYSAQEVRQACHKFMEDYRTMGLQHREEAGDRVKILENFIAPCDLTIDSKFVHKGTWLLCARVVDQELWGKVKKGEITGFSIGGIANRKRVA